MEAPGLAVGKVKLGMSAEKAVLSVNKEYKNFTCRPGDKMQKELLVEKKIIQKQFRLQDPKSM